jgi:hypothetical protein
VFEGIESAQNMFKYKCSFRVTLTVGDLIFRMINSYTVLMKRFLNKRQFGRTRSRLKNNTKIYIREVMLYSHDNRQNKL